METLRGQRHRTATVALHSLHVLSTFGSLHQTSCFHRYSKVILKTFLHPAYVSFHFGPKNNIKEAFYFMVNCLYGNCPPSL